MGLPWLFPEEVEEKPQIDLAKELPDAIDDLKAIFEARVTPDSVKPMAANLLQLTELVVAHFLRSHGLNALEMRRQIDPDYRPLFKWAEEIESDDTVVTLYRFLQHISAWIGAGYREQMLSQALRESSDAPLTSRFLTGCDELVASLNEDRIFLFRRDLKSGANKAGQDIQELQRSRNLCISLFPQTLTSEAEAASVLGEIPPDHAVVFLLNVPVPQTEVRDQLSVLLAFSAAGAKIYMSSTASRRWWNVYLANRTYRGAIRETLRLHEGNEISKTLSRFSQTCLTDLTRMNTPLSATDPDGPIVIESRMPRGKSLPENPTIQLWSPYLTHEAIRVDQSERVVEIDGSAIGPHPNLPVDESELYSPNNKLLAFAAFEKWSLADLAGEGYCEFALPPTIDREAFLSNDWDRHDVVHLSSHGEAFAEIPDATNVLLGQHTQERPPRFHYNDVLRLDFSGVSLVVLNVCMTKYGIQWANDEDLSLAWAFRASGAKSVIASRWNVPDAAAWYFAHWLYDALLREKQTIRAAFTSAVWKVRGHDLFRTPDIWGTFSLLD